MNPLVWLLFAACLALSFIFSGMEAGVFALSPLRIRQQMRAGRASAKVLHDSMQNPESFLWTILVGNTIANFLIFGVLVAALHGLPTAWFVVVYLLLVFLFYTFFDLLPKMLFRTYPNRLCLFFARPFQGSRTLLAPLVGLVEYFSGLILRWRGGTAFTGRLFGNREELRLVMQESAQSLSSEERTMINRVMDLQNLAVRQIMKPLPGVVTVSSNDPVGEALQLCREKNYTRLPVWETRDGSQKIIGLVSCNDLVFRTELDPAKPIRDFVRPALYLGEDLRLEVALRRMQRSGLRLAIVLGRDRREIGIITLQDVLQAIFGEVSL